LRRPSEFEENSRRIRGEFEENLRRIRREFEENSRRIRGKCQFEDNSRSGGNLVFAKKKVTQKVPMGVLPPHPPP